MRLFFIACHDLMPWIAPIVILTLCASYILECFLLD